MVRESIGFDKSIKFIYKLRKSRQKVYGDGWKTSPLAYDLWMLYGKLLRSIYIIHSKNRSKQSYEKLEDTLADFVVYSLFALEKFLVYKSKKNKNDMKFLFGIEE